MEEPGQDRSELETRAASASWSGSFKSGPPGATVDSQLKEAVRLKTEGNTFYREKNFRSAIGRYHRSLLVLRSLDANVMAAVKGFGPEAPVLTAEQEEILRSTQVDCYHNLAGNSSSVLPRLGTMYR